MAERSCAAARNVPCSRGAAGPVSIYQLLRARHVVFERAALTRWRRR